MQAETGHAQKVSEHFSQFSQNWYKLYENPRIANDIVLRNRKNLTLDFLARYIGTGTKILDAGCGTGVISMEAVQRGFTVHGIDIAKKMIKICKRNFSQSAVDTSKYAFMVGDIMKSDLQKNAYDGIIAVGFLEYLPDEQKALDALYKLLKPGGVLVISGPIKIRIANLFGLMRVYLRIKYGILNTLVKLGLKAKITGPNPAAYLSVNRYSFRRFKTLLEASHFQILDYKRHGYANFSYLKGLKNRHKIEMKLNRLLTKVSKILPIDRFANDIVVVAQK